MSMVDYAVVETATGRVLQIGRCPADAAQLQGGAGLSVVEIEAGSVDDDRHYLGAEGWAEYPPRPGAWAVFDYAAGAWIDPRTPDQITGELQLARLAAVAAINSLSAEVRRHYVTDIPGQDALYLLKEAEARAWVASADPAPAQFPLISAEIGITAPSGDEVAQVYLNLAALYVAAAAQLETARLGHIAMAEAAPDATAAAAIAQAFADVLQQSAEAP